MQRSIFIRVVIYAGLGVVLLLAARFAQTSMHGNNDIGLPPVKIDRKTAKLLDGGNWHAALETLIPAFEHNSGDPNLGYYIAWCYKELGMKAFQEKQYSEASQFLELGHTYVDDDPELFLAMGLVRLSQSDYTNAESAFQNAIALDPDNYLGHKHLGQIYYLRDDGQSAEASWSRAVALNPKDHALQKRLTKLQKELQVSEAFETDADHHFSVYYDGVAMPQLGNSVIDILDEAYYDIGSKLKAYPKRQIAVTLLTREAYFDVTGSPGWTAGLYEGQIKIPVANADPVSLKQTLFHEYVHAVIFDQMGDRCPWWLNEGLAQYFSGDVTGNAQKRTLALNMFSKNSDRSLKDLFKMLNNGKFASQAYALALSAVDFLIASYGEVTLQYILEELAAGKSIDAALMEVMDMSFETFESEWENALVLSLTS